MPYSEIKTYNNPMFHNEGYIPGISFKLLVEGKEFHLCDRRQQTIIAAGPAAAAHFAQTYGPRLQEFWFRHYGVRRVDYEGSPVVGIVSIQDKQQARRIFDELTRRGTPLTAAESFTLHESCWTHQINLDLADRWYSTTE